MKAILCEKHGPPEDLVVRDVAMPMPVAGEMRVRMQAAGVNFPDGLIIQNLYQTKPPLPFSPGAEMAGIVDAVGDGVTGFVPGDRVAGMITFGAFAEYIVVAADRVSPIPDGMDFDAAAGFHMVYGTSYHALKQRAQLQPGETVLVLGAAGGVGLAAVELAKAMGARVIAAASSDEKLALTRDYGADETVNYATQDLKSTVMALTQGKGVDVVYDPVGDTLADPAFRTMGWNGRYLVVGFAGGNIPSLPLNLPLIKGAAIIGVFWGAFTNREPAVNQQNLDVLHRLFADGKLRPHIDRRFPFAEGAQAIRWVMDRKAKGKVILTA